MTQELIDSVNTLTGETTKLLDEYVQAKTTIDAKVIQAANSATASTSQAGISATKAAEAAGHVTSAETAKSSAAGSASAAAASAAEASAIAGMDTVQVAVQTALDGRRWEARSFADMMQMREFNNELYAASGMVHAGKHRDDSGQYGEAINQGLWSYTAAPNNLMLGGDATNLVMSGLSKTGAAITHIAGFTSKLVNINSTSIDASKIRFPEAEKGCRVYDKNTGQSINYETDIDPKYGDVAPDLNEAVSRAWEGPLLKNGDMRFGDDGSWFAVGGSPLSIANGTITLTQTSAGSVQFARQNLAITAGDIIKAQVRRTAGNGNIYLGTQTPDNSDSLVPPLNEWYDLEVVATGSNSYFSIGGSSANEVGDTVEIRNVSIRPASQQVVVNRVDVAALEFYLQKVTPERPYVFNKGMVQSAAADINGVSTEDTTYPDSYHACFPTDTESSKKGVNIYAKSVIEIDAMVSDPDNNIWWIREGDEFYFIQFCCRQRTFAGNGNGDWGSIDPSRIGTTNRRLFKWDDGANTTITLVSPQGALDTPKADPGHQHTFQTYGSGAGANVTADHKSQGVFSMNNTNDGAWADSVAYDRTCFLYVLGHVPRLNQGSYMPGLNEMGAAALAHVDNPASYRAWHIDNARIPKTSKDCFVVATVDAGFKSAQITTGAIAGEAIRCGRSDGRFYDAIYASGISGFVDLRPKYGAWDASSAEQASEVRSEVEAGEYRGVEGLKFTTVHAVNNSVCAGSFTKDSGFTQYSTGFYVLSSDLTGVGGDYVENNVRYFILSGDNGNTKVLSANSTRKAQGQLPAATTSYLYFTGIVETTLSKEHGELEVELNTLFPNGTVITIHIIREEDTNTTVSGDFLMQEVIGSPESILQCEALEEGWAGVWNPVIPDGTLKTYNLTRKNVGGTPTLISTTDNGSTWSSGTWPSFDSTINGRTNWAIAANTVYINHFTAFAKQTKPAVNQPVLHGRAGVGDVSYFSAPQTDYGALTIETFLGKVPTSSVNPKNGTVNLTRVSMTVDGAINNASVLPVEHSTMALGAIDSAAVKALAYQTETNAQANLAFAFNELKHNGTDWGDSGKVVIADDTTTFSDDNGQSCLAGTAELALPYGYIKNNH